MRTSIVITLLLAGLACGGASAAGDVDPQLKRGSILFFQCRSCHDTSSSGVQKVGPNLHCFFGRAAAAEPSYPSYSDALRDSGVVWSVDTLDQWLKQPATLVPGTTMAFAGIAVEADRSALIAFLQHETACAP